MAFSSAIVQQGVVGDLRYAIFTWTAGTDASGVIATGLEGVIFASAANSENFAESPKVEVNTGSAGAVSGSVKLTFADAINNTGRIYVLGH